MHLNVPTDRHRAFSRTIWDGRCIVRGRHDPTNEKEPVEQAVQSDYRRTLRVHEELGSGLLNRLMRRVLHLEIVELGLQVVRQKPLPLIYRGRRVDCGDRIDMLVNDSVVVEVKAIEQLARVHAAQLRSHLKLSDLKLGLLINFNVHRLRDGIKRVVNGFPE